MWTTAFAMVPVAQNFGQSARAVWQHTLVINSHRDDVQTSWLDGLNSIHIHEFLAENTLAQVYPVTVGIPRFRESFNSLGEAVGCARGQEGVRTVSVWNVRVKMLANELIDKSRQRRETLAGAILQGCCDINLF